MTSLGTSIVWGIDSGIATSYNNNFYATSDGVYPALVTEQLNKAQTQT